MSINISPYRYGALPTSEAWTRKIYIGDDLSVPADSTLTVSADSIFVADGKKIEVYGKLKVTAGTIFTKVNGGTYWSGIDVKSGGTLEATSDFTIQYADCGIDLYSGATMKNGNYTISVKNCRQAGVWANDTTTYIQNILCNETSTSSYQNGAISVSGTLAAPKISRCKLMNSYYGIKIASTFASPMASVDSCIIRFQTSHGIVVNSNCRVDLNGHNNIYPTGNNKALNNPSTGAINANNNYWGSYPFTWANIITFPNVVTKDTVATTPWDSTTVAGIYKRLFLAESPKNLYDQADDLETSGDWSGAVDLYKQLISNETDSGNRKFILLSMLRIADNYSHDYSYIRNVAQNDLKTASSWYKASLDYLLCDLPLREGKPSESLSEYRNKIDEYKGTGMEVEMLAKVAEICGDYLQDKAQAKEYAERAARLNPGQENLRFAFASAGVEYDPWQFANKFAQDASNGKSEPIAGDGLNEFVSVTPNPANPVTTITYSIKAPSAVKLSVYAINGQKVATLVNGQVSAGRHSVKFDGSRLASGVYFYRFESAGLNKTGKILLLK